MLTDVLAALPADRGARRGGGRHRRAGRGGARTGYGARVVSDTREAGQSPAAQLGIDALEGARRVLLVPGDCPLLDPTRSTRCWSASRRRRRGRPRPPRHRDERAAAAPAGRDRPVVRPRQPRAPHRAREDGGSVAAGGGGAVARARRRHAGRPRGAARRRWSDPAAAPPTRVGCCARLARNDEARDLGGRAAGLPEVAPGDDLAALLATRRPEISPPATSSSCRRRWCRRPRGASCGSRTSRRRRARVELAESSARTRGPSRWCSTRPRTSCAAVRGVLICGRATGSCARTRAWTRRTHRATTRSCCCRSTRTRPHARCGRGSRRCAAWRPPS